MPSLYGTSMQPAHHLFVPPIRAIRWSGHQRAERAPSAGRWRGAPPSLSVPPPGFALRLAAPLIRSALRSSTGAGWDGPGYWILTGTQADKCPVWRFKGWKKSEYAKIAWRISFIAVSLLKEWMVRNFAVFPV